MCVMIVQEDVEHDDFNMNNVGPQSIPDNWRMYETAPSFSRRETQASQPDLTAPSSVDLRVGAAVCNILASKPMTASATSVYCDMQSCNAFSEVVCSPVSCFGCSSLLCIISAPALFPVLSLC